MKSFRRSLNDKERSSTKDLTPEPLPSTSIPSMSKPSASIQPPKKVIRAKESHVSSSPQELPFIKGDFFYVVGERDDPRGGPGYYEALNTISNARGLVPKAKFEEFGRGGAHGSKGSISESGRSSLASSQQSNLSKSTGHKSPQNSQKQLFGRMLYDFQAERDDELSALKDEPMLIQALSTEDWFVAKKISTVSKPGLIPVSFVEILDPATGNAVTDVQKLIRESGLPDVKEWRAKADSYANTSIPLGRLDDGGVSQGVPNSPYADYQTNQPSGGQLQAQQQQAQHQATDASLRSSQSRQPQHAQQPSLSRSIQSEPDDRILPPGTFSSANVISFHKEKVHGQDEYFFRLHAVFLPNDRSKNAARLILFRTYDHFYRFQIDLLDTFPAEAGRQDPRTPHTPPPKRILPYMPGPLPVVDDAITHDRRTELDNYIRFLIGLHRIDASYILSDRLVRAFFTPAESDNIKDVSRDVAQRELDAERAQEPMMDLEENMDNLNLGGNRASASPPHQHQQPQSSGSQRTVTQRNPSSSSRSTSHHSNGSHGGARNTSPLPPIDTTNLRRTPYSASNGLSAQTTSTQSSRPPSHDSHSGGLPSAAPTSSSWGSNGGGGALNAGFSPMTPAPLTGTSHTSGSGPTAAYKKIKIYDSNTDDVMAIRVPPNVTFEGLSQKVQDRLGGGRRALSYRDSVGGTGKGTVRRIGDDRDILEWMGRTDRLVLYAD